eukprot:12421822-Karenia_brevis.AAC.1
MGTYVSNHVPSDENFCLQLGEVFGLAKTSFVQQSHFTICSDFLSGVSRHALAKSVISGNR